MDYTLGISSILLAVLAGGGLPYLYRQIVKRRERQNIDIPDFLRSDGAGDDIDSNIKIHPDIVNIHPWGKAK